MSTKKKNKIWLRRLTSGLADTIKRARGGMHTPKQRLLGHFESLFIDHAVFRLAYANRHRLTDKMYRASQPSPSHVRQAADAGIKTIINLRGSRDCASYILEAEACRRYGVHLVDFPVKSRDVPSRETLHKIRDIFDSIEYPALLHCKSGADRAGLVSVLFMLVHEGRPLDDAMRHLSWRFGHVKQAKTGMLDYFFALYRDYNAQTPISFFDWVDNVYDPEAARAGYQSGRWADRLVDGVLGRE